jgi:hypothetical protein
MLEFLNNLRDQAAFLEIRSKCLEFQPIVRDKPQEGVTVPDVKNIENFSTN